MESRVNKYYSNNFDNNSINATRSSRNANLYRHIYGKYEDLDNDFIDDIITKSKNAAINYLKRNSKEFKDLLATLLEQIALTILVPIAQNFSLSINK